MDIIQQKDIGEMLMKKLPFTSALTLYEASHRRNFINIHQDYTIFKNIQQLPFHSLMTRVHSANKLIIGKGPIPHGFLINICKTSYDPYIKKYVKKQIELVSDITILVSMNDIYHIVKLDNDNTSSYKIFYPKDTSTPHHENELIKLLFQNIFKDLVFEYSEEFTSRINMLDSFRIRVIQYVFPQKYSGPISKDITRCHPVPPVGNSPDDITTCYDLDDKGEYVAIFHKTGCDICITVQYRYLPYSEKLQRYHMRFQYTTICVFDSGFVKLNQKKDDQDIVEKAPLDMILCKINKIIYVCEKNLDPSEGRIFKVIPRYPMIHLKSEFLS